MEKQTILGEDGNCFETCLACLLGISVREVPLFNKENVWFKDAKKFVSKFGYDIFCALMPAGGFSKEEYPLEDDTIYIMGGTSPRGIKHAVIYQGRNMLFDPHPDNTGLETEDSIFVLVPKDPKYFQSFISFKRIIPCGEFHGEDVNG